MIDTILTYLSLPERNRNVRGTENFIAEPVTYHGSHVLCQEAGICSTDNSICSTTATLELVIKVHHVASVTFSLSSPYSHQTIRYCWGKTGSSLRYMEYHGSCQILNILITYRQSIFSCNGESEQKCCLDSICHRIFTLQSVS